jgi:hypothetical protein
MLGRLNADAVALFCVLNKVDYLSVAGAARAQEFTERVLADELGRPVAVWAVSARSGLAARIARRRGGGPGERAGGVRGRVHPLPDPAARHRPGSLDRRPGRPAGRRNRRRGRGHAGRVGAVGCRPAPADHRIHRPVGRGRARPGGVRRAGRCRARPAAGGDQRPGRGAGRGSHRPAATRRAGPPRRPGRPARCGRAVSAGFRCGPHPRGRRSVARAPLGRAGRGGAGAGRTAGRAWTTTSARSGTRPRPCSTSSWWRCHRPGGWSSPPGSPTPSPPFPARPRRSRPPSAVTCLARWDAAGWPSMSPTRWRCCSTASWAGRGQTSRTDWPRPAGYCCGPRRSASTLAPAGSPRRCAGVAHCGTNYSGTAAMVRAEMAARRDATATLSARLHRDAGREQAAVAGE